MVQPDDIPDRPIAELSLPEFHPFAGVRYDCDCTGAALGTLAAPPYDVVDEDERGALEASHDCNAVRLILPRDETAEGDRYERAASTFAEWLARGVLVRDDGPRFYAYRMTFTDAQGRPRHTRGVIGALGVPAARAGHDAAGVLPHERTLPKAKSDRLSLLRAMRVNADPIWGLSLGEGLTDLVDRAALLCECTDSDGVHHELGAIDDPATIAAIETTIRGAPLVLADGHHRFETATNYRNERAAEGVDDPGAGAIMCFVVELVDDELCIEPIHRLVGLPAGTDLRTALADAFDVHAAGPNTPEEVEALVARMRDARGLGLVDGEGLALAVPRPAVASQELATEHPAVAGTDAAVVEALVVPRLPGASWQYRHDAAACAALVDKGAAGAAILCTPVTVADTRAAATAGTRMPQKTTFFWPKPRTGMVFRPLD